jgi:uncharacterized membrane protein
LRIDALTFKPIVAERLSLLIRRLLGITTVARTDSSFCFIHRDLSLKPRATLPPEVKGET